MTASGVHVATAGAPIGGAAGVAVLLHGRGASAASIVSLSEAFALPHIAYLAPQAPDHAWYPQSFLAPLAHNEPFLSRSLSIVGAVLADIFSHGIGAERVALIGFSQGGCLALEFAARNARRYGGLIGFSAGLIGPRETPRDYAGSLDGTPALLGCSDTDAHIPLWRVQETTQVLRGMSARVTERIYPQMGHTINDDEVRQARALLAALTDAPADGVRRTLTSTI